MPFLQQEEQLNEPLSDKELKYARWYLENQPLFRRLIIGLLAAIDIVFLLVTVFGAVKLFYRPYLSDIREQLKESAIGYESFRIALEPRPLVVRQISILSTGSEARDLAAEIVNPNSGWLVRRVVFQFTTPNRVLPPITTFFLPGEDRLVALFRAEGVSRSDQVSIIVSGVVWERVRGVVPQAPFQTDSIVTETLTIQDDVLITRVSGQVKNVGPRGYWQIPFLIILRRGDQLLAVRQAVLERFKSGEEREIEARLLGRFPQGITVDIKPVFNPFDDNNLLPLDLDKP